MTGGRAESVYRRFMDDPKSGRSSYLYDHYQRGLIGIMEPGIGHTFAHAAWRAGRDTSSKEQP